MKWIFFHRVICQKAIFLANNGLECGALDVHIGTVRAEISFFFFQCPQAFVPPVCL
jgi:hypothetical protein